MLPSLPSPSRAGPLGSRVPPILGVVTSQDTPRRCLFHRSVSWAGESIGNAPRLHTGLQTQMIPQTEREDPQPEQGAAAERGRGGH